MKIAYGPPGAVGVKHLAYVGDAVGDDADYVTGSLHRVAKPLGIISVGFWAYGAATKNRRLKKQALAVGIGALLVELLTRP